MLRHPLAATIVAIACLALGAACSRSASGPAAEPAIEDVAPALDADLSLAGEETARRRAAAMSGVLPGDFPAGLPVYSPSSVVDFGETETGPGRYVVLFSPEAPDRVRGRWRAQLSAAGWQLEGGGATWTLSRDAQRARAVVTAASPGTEIRIDYRPGG